MGLEAAAAALSRRGEEREGMRGAWLVLWLGAAPRLKPSPYRRGAGRRSAASVASLTSTTPLLAADPAGAADGGGGATVAPDDDDPAMGVVVVVSGCLFGWEPRVETQQSRSRFAGGVRARPPAPLPPCRVGAPAAAAAAAAWKPAAGGGGAAAAIITMGVGAEAAAAAAAGGGGTTRSCVLRVWA
jgi:hypothetical protein